MINIATSDFLFIIAGQSVTVIRLSCSAPASTDEHHADAVGRGKVIFRLHLFQRLHF